MKTWRVVIGAALAAMIVAMGSPSPAAAQFGGLKKKLKAKLVQAVVEEVVAAGNSAIADTAATSGSGESLAAARATGIPVVKKPMPGAPARPGPTFTEYVLEMTPELLDRFAQGLTAEQAVRQDIERMVGKQLPREQYDQCFQAVVASPEGQRVYMSASELMNGDASQEQMRKASEELGRRMLQLAQPKCGMDPSQAQELRQQHRQRLELAAPNATGLTALQLSILKERILPFCAAANALVKAAGEARLATGAESIFWVYAEAEVAALAPRCAGLVPVLRTSL